MDHPRHNHLRWFNRRDGMQQHRLSPTGDSPVVQAFGSLVPARPGLSDEVRMRSVAMFGRLVGARELILLEARPFACAAADGGDLGTNDLIVSQVVRGNELQSWFVTRHLTAQEVRA